MKKVLAIALIAGSLAACNNNSDKKTTNEDTIKTNDTLTVVTPGDTTTVIPVDTTAKPDTIK